MASHRQSKGPRILVVEDDRDTRETVCEALRHYGFEVRDAGGYASALETAARFSPHVLVCDWQLGPGTRDGVDVASALQKSLDAKVIFITGRPPSVLRERARSMRIVDIIRKPVSLPRLILAIGRAG